MNAGWFTDPSGRVHCAHCEWVARWEDDDEPWLTWALHDVRAMHTAEAMDARLEIDDLEAS